MKLLFRSTLAATLLFGATACDGDEDPPDTPDVEDVGVDVIDAETPDVIDAADTDGSGDVADVAPDVSTSCADGAECADGFICVDEVCESLSCRNANDWPRCQALFNSIEDDMGRFATCEDQVCRVACYHDWDCGDGQLCTDFGHCADFTGDLSLEVPHGPATGTLEAGVANVLLNYPIGTPPGGYGTRVATNDGRYALSLRASAGQLHGMYSRAVALDNGERHAMIIRLPLIFTQAGLHEAVARALQEETGEDWRNNIIISSTHTHSGPCRHWHLPREAAAPLGAFGIGEFSQVLYDWLEARVVESALAALADLEPAKIGWEILEAYDTDDQVAHDRWSQTPPFDDNRALLIRVDDLDDVPRAVMVSFGAHGTMNDVEYLSGDGVGRVERSLEDALGEEFDRFVPVMFLNQNSGTMGPAGGKQGHAFPMNLERLGYAFVEKTWDAILDIETTTELTLNSHVMRFPISYDYLGYERDEFAGGIRPPLGGEYHYGGLSCVGPEGGDEDFETHDTLERMNCSGALQFLLYNAPPTTMVRSQMTMMELNGLTLGTVPGELSMELSWQMLRALRDEFGVDPLTSWTLGYANDHLFYLLPTNLRGDDPPFPGQSTPQPIDDYPDFAFSYFQGGYETTMSMWGPSGGDFLVDRFVETYHRMTDAAFEPAFEEPLPSQYTHRDDQPFEITNTPDDIAGTWTIEPPTDVERFETIEFAWYGGDPGAEQPQVPVVTIEENIEGWAPVILPNRREYTNLEWRFLTRVRQHADTDHWEWVIRWEELAEFPRGEYRWRINGHYHDMDGERVPYELISAPFNVNGTDDIFVEAVADATAISGRIGYPAAQSGSMQGPASDPGQATGNYRMRHPMVPTGQPGPIEAIDEDGVIISLTDGENTYTATGLTVTTAPEAIGGRSNVPVTRFDGDWDSALSAGDYTLTITVTDALGNTGTFESDVTL